MTNAKEGGLSFEGNYIPQPPPGAQVAVGYWTVTNHAEHGISLLSASSDAFAKIEFHLSVLENGVARMLPQETIDVPAGESVEFTHGGYHLMLMGAKSALQVGDEIQVRLETDHGPMQVTLMVLGKNEAMDMKHGHGAQKDEVSGDKAHKHQ